MYNSNQMIGAAAEDSVAPLSSQFSVELTDCVESVVVDLRITQMVNGVRGVHAVLPHGAIEPAALAD